MHSSDHAFITLVVNESDLKMRVNATLFMFSQLHISICSKLLPPRSKSVQVAIRYNTLNSFRLYDS